MQPLFEHRRSFGGFSTRVLELEGDGHPLVLLHGWADSADTWRRVLERLGRAERRAVAVDLPGFGAADGLDGDGSVLDQLDRFAADVAAYAADGKDPVVAGNSLGGTVALRLASHDEVGLAGIAPIAPAGLDMPRWFSLVERDPFLRHLLAMPTPVPEPVVRSLVGRAYRLLAFADPSKATAELVAAFTSHHRDRAAVRRYLATARRMLPELDLGAELAAIRCPVLLVWGDRDRMVSHREPSSSRGRCRPRGWRCCRGSATARSSRPPSGSSSCCSASRTGRRERRVPRVSARRTGGTRGREGARALPPGAVALRTGGRGGGREAVKRRPRLAVRGNRGRRSDGDRAELSLSIS